MVKTLLIAASMLIATNAAASPSMTPLVMPRVLENGDQLLFCAENVDMCMDLAEQTVRFDLKMLTRVNNSVNHSIIYREEKINKWSIYPIYGDCEDYALTKMFELIKAGYSRAALRLTIVVIKETGEKHMVLNVETDQGTYVLDNRSDKVLRWDKINYYRWIATEQYIGNSMLFHVVNDFWNN